MSGCGYHRTVGGDLAKFPGSTVNSEWVGLCVLQGAWVH